MASLLPPTAAGAKPDPKMFPAQTFGVKPTIGTAPLLAPPQIPAAQAAPAAAPKAVAVQPDVAYTAARREALNNELSQMRTPEAPTLDKVPAPPPYQQTDAFSGIAPVMMVLAGLAAGKTKQHATTMLNSFAEFNKARQAGDAKKMEASHAAWKDAAQQVVDSNKAKSDEFKAVVEGNKSDQRSIQAELTALYTANKDFTMLEKLNTDGGLAAARESHMAEQDATAEMRAFIDAQYKGVGTPGTGGAGGAGGAAPQVNPQANPQLPQNDLHLEYTNPNASIRGVSGQNKGELQTRKANEKFLADNAPGVEAAREQNMEYDRVLNLLPESNPALMNRAIGSMGSGFDSVIDELNKININASLLSAPKAAGRNLGVKMEQLLMQAAPGPNMTGNAARNLITVKQAVNDALLDRTDFVTDYLEGAKNAGFTPSVTQAQAEWEKYMRDVGYKIDTEVKSKNAGDPNMIQPNPKYVTYKEYFPLASAAKMSKAPIGKVLEYYNMEKAKGTPLEDIVNEISHFGGK